ncbi:MAG: nucleotide exchange factor GrpE [Pirellulaceae bacterium]
MADETNDDLIPEEEFVADSTDEAFCDDAAATSSETPESVSKLQAELEEANNRVLRSQAELENFRRRMRREMQDERKFAAQPLLTDLLPIVDNIERAIESAQQSSDQSGLLDGVKMVAGQLLAILEKHDCPRIQALGEDFDPNMHEAIGHQPSDQYESGKVMLVAGQGYRLHDRVIRPAQVIVSKGQNA